MYSKRCDKWNTLEQSANVINKFNSMECLEKSIKKNLSVILVGLGEKKRLANLFDTTYNTVRKALSGKSGSLLSIKIRNAAIERGGMEIKSSQVKES